MVTLKKWLYNSSLILTGKQYTHANWVRGKDFICLGNGEMPKAKSRRKSPNAVNMCPVYNSFYKNHRNSAWFRCFTSLYNLSFLSVDLNSSSSTVSEVWENNNTSNCTFIRMPQSRIFWDRLFNSLPPKLSLWRLWHH